MKALDKRQKALLAGLLAAVVFIVVLLLIPVLVKEKPQEESSVVAVIPEADLTEGDDSKTASYRNGNISDYWDELGKDNPEPVSPDIPGQAPSEDLRGKGSRRPPAMEVDDIFGDYRNAPAPEPAHKQSRGSGKGQRSSPAKESSAETKPAGQAAATEEAPKPRAQVKRSGAVSSLDEDVSGDLGNGFSTLDGTDRWVGGEAGKPYRCMFTRDEKVKSGQRITVRLLEDLVIGTTHVPRNTHLQGLVNISDRMEVSITSLDMGGKILTFHFEAFDTDGGKGIYCSDLSQTRKEITEQGVATASTTLNSRLGRVARDAASVGASIVRSKSGEATVSVPAGYTFYIIEQER
jgi:hypothetical protein